MKDRVILLKITDYLKRVRGIYETIKDLDEASLLRLNDSYALTQFLTNIHSLSQNLSNEDIAADLIRAGFKNLNTCRNISAHDYDSLNWSLVKGLCRRLISEDTAKVINECIKLAEADEERQKKYGDNKIL